VSRLASEIAKAYFWDFARNPYQGGRQAELATLFDGLLRAARASPEDLVSDDSFAIQIQMNSTAPGDVGDDRRRAYSSERKRMVRVLRPLMTRYAMEGQLIPEPTNFQATPWVQQLRQSMVGSFRRSATRFRPWFRRAILLILQNEFKYSAKRELQYLSRELTRRALAREEGPIQFPQTRNTLIDFEVSKKNVMGKVNRLCQFLPSIEEVKNLWNDNMVQKNPLVFLRIQGFLLSGFAECRDKEFSRKGWEIAPVCQIRLRRFISFNPTTFSRGMGNLKVQHDGFRGFVRRYLVTTKDSTR
jgi:hypothetical protein